MAVVYSASPVGAFAPLWYIYTSACANWRDFYFFLKRLSLMLSYFLKIQLLKIPFGTIKISPIVFDTKTLELWKEKL